MDKESLYQLMEDNGLSRSDLLAHYSFSGASGNVLFNEAYEVSGENWMTGAYLNWSSVYDARLDADKYPAISRKSSDIANSSAGSDGSGYFTGDSILSVGTGVHQDDWTAFISYSGGLSDDRKGLSNILLATNSKPNDTSGFFVGHNSRSLFVENCNTGAQSIYTHQAETSDKNIISVSKDEYGLISIGLHEFSNLNNTDVETIELSDYTDSNQIYIGGFIDNDVPAVLGYTGFSGYMDQFILLSGLLSNREKADISRAMYASDYSPAGYITQTSEFVVESGMSLVTGVVDSGITGYEDVSVGSVGGVDLYISSGVTGEITGTFYSGITGSGIGTTVETIFSGESFTYDENEIKSYSPSIISFKNTLAADDVFEIYSQNAKLDTINLTTSYDRSQDAFFTSTDFTGIEKNGEIALIYANGKLLESGNSNTGMFQRVDDYSISASGYSGVDTVVYDMFKDYNGGQVHYEGASATGLNFTTSFFMDKDVYFEGVKLLSGAHWEQGSNYIDINSVGYPISYGSVGVGDGTYIFTPTSKNFTRITGNPGSDGSTVQTNTNLINEQVWLNGLKQVRNQDYYLVSESSSMNTTSRQTPATSILYSGQTGLYNV